MKIGDSLQKIEYHVDFLIVTALIEERDAVLAHFENTRKVQLEGSPTYYVSTLPVVGQDTQYEVAVTMLKQMGNVEAAQHTTRAISGLNPSVVLMVGIAGGVKGEVELGDVVVASQVLYYEQAKQYPDGILQRPQMYPVDQILLDRAQNYSETDWHSLILAENPVTGEMTTPKVVFGPIAAGEKVITDPAFVDQLKDIHSKLVGIEMESFGVAVAAANASDRPRFLAIRGICDYADPEKDDLWREYAAATAAAFAIGFLRSAPIPPKASPVSEVIRSEDRANTLIVIRHQSMEFFPERAIQKSLPPELVHIKEIKIDQSDLYMGGRLVDPLKAAKRQMDLIPRINSLLEDYPGSELAYYGIAHIPLLFLAGYHLSNKFVLHLFEFNRKTGHWDQLHGRRDRPRLELEEAPLDSKSTPGDVVLRISVSYEITLDDIAGIVPSPIASLHLRVREPKIDIVTNEHQIQTYSALFRATLDEIHNKLPNTQRVHLFYAGPVTLALNFGRQISKTIHPRIVVYNYFAKDFPRYSWGLEITSEIDSEDFFVRPQPSKEV